MFPLAAEDDLEMRNRVSGDFPAHAVEAEVGHVVLTAAIEATADFDVQILNSLVGSETLLANPLAQLRGKPACYSVYRAFGPGIDRRLRPSRACNRTYVDDAATRSAPSLLT